jgi:dGTPase
MTANLYGPTDLLRRADESELPSRSALRQPFVRDLTRLIRAEYFRKLQGKTQLFPGHEADFFRTRLTHSVEVARVAKSIALHVNSTNKYFQSNPIDLDLVEFAALAHDLGHPPFGHVGEKALDDAMKQTGGFEGNAQTLRILANREPMVVQSQKNGNTKRYGLNATARSLAAILKYDLLIPSMGGKTQGIHKGFYSEESEVVSWIKSCVGSSSPHFRTIECSIMDLADDIAYSVHDLEDAFKAGFVSPLSLFTADEVIGKTAGRLKFSVTDIFNGLFSIFSDLFPSDQGDGYLQADPGLSDFLKTAEAYKANQIITSNSTYRSRFFEELTERFLSDVHVQVQEDNPKESKVALGEETAFQVQILKQMNFALIISSPTVELIAKNGHRIVTQLFEILSSPDGAQLLPDEFKVEILEAKNILEHKRLICDFVAGMTNARAIEYHKRIFDPHGPGIFRPLN